MRGSHLCGRCRGQVSGAAGGGCWHGHAGARCPDGGIGGHRGGGTQASAHIAAGKVAGAPLAVPRWLAPGHSSPLAPPFQEVGQHLTLALHTDLSSAYKVIVIHDDAVHVLCHLEIKKKGMEQ